MALWIGVLDDGAARRLARIKTLRELRADTRGVSTGIARGRGVSADELRVIHDWIAEGPR